MKPILIQLLAFLFVVNASGQMVFNGTSDNLAVTVNTADGAVYALQMPSGMHYDFPAAISGLSATDTNLGVSGSLSNSGTAGVAICLSQTGQLTIYTAHTMATDVSWFLWGFFTCVLLAMAGATRRLLARAFEVPPEL